MGISSGSKGGGKGYGGKGKERSRALVTPPAQRTKHRPIENQYPEKEAFRLGTFRVIEEKDDYLICRGYDPNAKHPFSEITPSASITIEVAKPPLLQRTPWDGVTVEIAGIEYTYEYSDDEFGVRTKRWTDEDDEEQEVEERIDIPYFVGDWLEAAEVAISPVVDGMVVNDTKTENENGALLTWMDQNVSGRHWHTPAPFEDCTLPIGDRFSNPTGTTEHDIEDHIMDRGCGWEYRVGGTGDITLGAGNAAHRAPGNTAQVVTYPDVTHSLLFQGAETFPGTSITTTLTMGTASGEGAEVHVYVLFRVEDNNNFYFVQLFVRGVDEKAVLALYQVNGGATNLLQVKRTNWSAAFGAVATMWVIDRLPSEEVDYGVNLYNGQRVEYPEGGTTLEEVTADLIWWQDEENWPQNFIVNRGVGIQSGGVEGRDYGVGFGARNYNGEFFGGTTFHCFSAGYGAIAASGE
jgi:hypothetical protein